MSAGAPGNGIDAATMKTFRPLPSVPAQGCLDGDADGSMSRWTFAGVRKERPYIRSAPARRASLVDAREQTRASLSRSRSNRAAHRSPARATLIYGATRVIHPDAFIQSATRSGQVVTVSFVRRRPYPCPPLGYRCISAGTFAFFNAR